MRKRRRDSDTGAQRNPPASNPPTGNVVGGGPNYAKNQARPSAPYVPQHAAASFVKTATPREMRKQNEIL
ncbi:hypothetical protein F4824DRAFT_499521 [Ustulina deusta]|nr:hypothetical protein F4824DRAFT_499521 [Ustulina deusta]